MCCGKKLKHTCGTKIPSTCVPYELEVPEVSKLHEEKCLVVEDTTKDIYELLTSIKESINLENLDKSCLDIDKEKDSYTKENTFKVNDVLQALIHKGCGSESSTESNDINFILQNLDYKCLNAECDTKPSNLFQFFQLLIDKICDE